MLRPWLFRLPIIGPRKVHTTITGRYRNKLRQRPNLETPRTLNELVTHRILHDRDPRLKLMCDKLTLRRLVEVTVGPEYVVPVLGQWKKAEQIDWKRLPRQFVLKPNNQSGPYRIVPNIHKADLLKLTAEASRWLQQDYFDRSLEWGYRGLRRRVIAEPLLKGPDGSALIEINAMTFSGNPCALQVLTGRKGSPQRCDAWYDQDGNRLSLKSDAPTMEATLTTEQLAKVQGQFERYRAEITRIARSLGILFAFVRVDIWITDDGLRVAELTPYPGGGRSTNYKSDDWDRRLGQMFFDNLPPYRGSAHSYPWPPQFANPSAQPFSR